MGEGRPLLERVKASHPYPAWKRYGDAHGDLLAAAAPPRATTGSRAVDRVSLAAGVILGAVGAAFGLGARRRRGAGR